MIESFTDIEGVGGLFNMSDKTFIMKFEHFVKSLAFVSETILTRFILFEDMFLKLFLFTISEILIKLKELYFIEFSKNIESLSVLSNLSKFTLLSVFSN